MQDPPWACPSPGQTSLLAGPVQQQAGPGPADRVPSVPPAWVPRANASPLGSTGSTELSGADFKP